MKPIQWAAIKSAPEAPGVYAWYYSPRFTLFDRRALEEKLSAEPSAVEITNFLERHLFQYFAESPYCISIRGPLKPTYAGTIEHDRVITPELSRRLVNDPTRRTVLWDALEQMVPYFTAPLYIGMAKNLRQRLSRHKYLIENGNEKLDSSTFSDSEDRRDAGFANEVVRRRMPIERLSVYVLELDKESAASAADVENILNRVNYPVLGRN